jgi:hypothetical protein
MEKNWKRFTYVFMMGQFTIVQREKTRVFFFLVENIQEWLQSIKMLGDHTVELLIKTLNLIWTSPNCVYESC